LGKNRRKPTSRYSWEVLTTTFELFFAPPVDSRTQSSPSGVRVLYISPLKALAVDVDRNLRGPIAGLRAYAERHEVTHCVPRVAVRSRDTPQKERTAIVRNPPEILITTPESLCLMLTSKADAALAHVETVIVDEIHALAGTNRGSHLVSSLERLTGFKLRHADDLHGLLLHLGGTVPRRNRSALS